MTECSLAIDNESESICQALLHAEGASDNRYNCVHYLENINYVLFIHGHIITETSHQNSTPH